LDPDFLRIWLTLASRTRGRIQRGVQEIRDLRRPQRLHF